MGNIMDKLQKQMRVKDQDAEREKILSRMQQDDFLLKQIDEFKEKAKQLQNILVTKENKVDELQEVLEEREEQARQFQQVLEEQQQEADLLVQAVHRQIDTLITRIDAQIKVMDETVHSEIRALDEKISGQTEELSRVSGQGIAAMEDRKSTRLNSSHWS